MSEHAWFAENVEVYLTDGLGPAERSRFEEHLASCDTCVNAFDDANECNRALKGLFADARPSPGFEDRLIQTLREAKRPMLRLPAAPPKVVLSVAAALVFAFVGYAFTEFGRIDSFYRMASGASEGVPAAPPLSGFMDQDKDLTLAQAYSPGPPPPSDLTTPEQIADGLRKEMLSGNLSSTTVLWGEDPKGETAGKDSFNGRGINSSIGGGRGYRGAFARSAPEKELEGHADASFRITAASRDASPEGPRFKPGELKEKKVLLVTKGEEKKAEDRERQQGRPLNRVQEKGQDKPATQEEPPAVQRKIIRSGEMEFEVESFDVALMQVAKIAGERSGFIATTSSEKLPNGKVRGSVVVRVPPEHLDLLILNLRALGDLKSSRIAAQDITKQYTDLESGLRAARAMETRLLEIIKSGKGEIKDLLAAEKELGVWREKIEKVEGEIRYYASMISLSTLTITLAEKDIKTPTHASEQEVVSMGLETDTVDKTYAAVLALIAELKGRVIQSDLKQHEAGQFSAQITAEVKADQSGPLRDRLQQLGRQARLSVERRQTTTGGVGSPTGVNVEQLASRFDISIYNLVTVAPRHTTVMTLAALDVEAAFQAILARVKTASGNVISSNLQRPQPDQITGTVRFEVKSADYQAILDDVNRQGQAVQSTLTENPDAQNVTEAKRGFSVTIIDAVTVPARESQDVKLATRDVAASFEAILAAVRDGKGRVTESTLTEQEQGNVSGTIGLEVTTDVFPAIDKAIAGQGDVLSRHVQRVPPSVTAMDTKVALTLTLYSAERIAPYQSIVMGIEVKGDVKEAYTRLLTIGKLIRKDQTTDPAGRVLGKVTFDVPLSEADGVQNRLEKDFGKVRTSQTSQSTVLPPGKLSRVQFVITIGGEAAILAADQGIWTTIRDGLATSAGGLLWSLNKIVIGVCLAGPWALIAWFGWKVVRRAKKAPGAVAS